MKVVQNAIIETASLNDGRPDAEPIGRDKVLTLSLGEYSWNVTVPRDEWTQAVWQDMNTRNNVQFKHYD